jgi:small subunit ribosomal protein S12|tara:strand:- start:5130 stop:5507 length:378 start_codon:yes stop_codon:yes gene_type:complete
MATKIQNLKSLTKNKKVLKKKALNLCPQKKGTCVKVFVTTPKKPNSASRKTAKVILLSNKLKVICHIPGIKHSLQRYSTVLIQGATVRDLPGIKYRAIRGKFDLKKVYDRTKSRSKYGIPKLNKS